MKLLRDRSTAGLRPLKSAIVVRAHFPQPNFEGGITMFHLSFDGLNVLVILALVIVSFIVSVILAVKLDK